MLYPVNIKIEKKEKLKIINEKIQDLLYEIRTKIKYIIFDRRNLSKIILVKLHI